MNSEGIRCGRHTKSGGSAREYQPFTAPEDRPLMMYFWKIRAMTTGGREASTPAVLVRMKSLPNLLENYPVFDAFLIDMAVGLKNTKDQVRPDNYAKRELGPKGASV